MAGLSPVPGIAPQGLRLHAADDPRRPEVEDFIRRVYAERYGATLSQFAPMLVSLADARGDVVAAAGYRAAGTGSLFLERYLGMPVEQALAARAGGEPTRADVVEIGHLAGVQAGAGRELIFLLGPHLAQQRFRWAVATLTRELLLLFSRLGIVPFALAPADPGRLGREAAQWGSYYQHEPVVLAGEIQPALRRLARRQLRGDGARA
ncbi:thermostable hemolysin [Ramlibacter sp. USB13]|uniref:Thermostable hemolysin n=1 Tax=Ramlibacter cellulosilyticus TaxID=2764187 RepID=A0A923MT03_9BURK|nr:thermostable hemolysin [Ramlibacter cellulosilyticus]MBC5784895.1 thermostable hemolysin [Ramlibacter cellulosilyticus]